MNTTMNTERPKLKLNFGTKPLTLTTNSNAVVTDPSAKKVVVIAKPKSDDIASTQADKVGSKARTSEADSDVATGAVKAKSTDASSNKVVASPEEILKDKIKRRKKEYVSILTKLQADYPEVFSIDPKPLAIGIHLELKKILNGKFANAQLGRFFHRYCGSFKYKEKLVEGAQRFNLDGSPATLVTKTEIPPMMNKPKNISDTEKTVINEIEPKK